MIMYDNEVWQYVITDKVHSLYKYLLNVYQVFLMIFKFLFIEKGMEREKENIDMREKHSLSSNNIIQLQV